MGSNLIIPKSALPIVIIICALLNQGCSSSLAEAEGWEDKSYWESRESDFCDIINLKLGTCYGVGARVGPIGAGYGIFASDPLTPFDQHPHPSPSRYHHLVVLFLGNIKQPSGVERGKKYEATTLIPFYYYLQEMSKDEIYPAVFFSQVQVFAGFLLGIHLEVNPGELLDFILGYTTLDIYGDDEYFYIKNGDDEYFYLKNAETLDDKKKVYKQTQKTDNGANVKTNKTNEKDLEKSLHKAAWDGNLNAIKLLLKKWS